MKRKTFVMLWLLFGAAATGLAQDALYEVPMTSLSAIVRNHIASQQWVIFDIDANVNKHFLLTDLTNTRTVELPSRYMVRDFEIYGDTVVFCGESNGQGFVGWFAIQDLFYGGGTFHVDETSLLQEGIGSLENIEVYADSSDDYVVGYGKDTSFASYVAFEAKGVSFGNLSYRAKPMTCDEIVCDIAVTNNYVVTASVMLNHATSYSPCGTALNVYPKTNVLGQATDQQYLYQTHTTVNPQAIPVVSTGSEPLNNQLRIAHKTGDIVAIASYNRISSMNPVDFFDIKTISLAGGSFVGNVKRILMEVQSATLQDFYYDPQSSTYVALHSNVQYQSTYPFSMVTKVNTTLTAPFVVNSDAFGPGQTILTGLCIDSPSGYLACGMDASNMLKLYRGTLSSVSNCSQKITYTCNEEDSLSNKQSYCTTKASPWHLLKTQEVLREDEKNVENIVDCE